MDAMEVDAREAEGAMPPPDSNEEAIDDDEPPSDPDAQAAITDFLDFTEYLPSDVARSFTLVEELEHKHVQATAAVRRLIASYQKLSSRALVEALDTSNIKTSISEKLNLAIHTRALAEAEARRTAVNVARHQQKLFQIQAKLDCLYESFPSAQEEAAAASHTVSAQATKVPKITIRLGEQGVHKGSRVKRGPRITVPGEVLAPNEFDWDTLESETEVSATPEAESVPAAQRRPSANGPKKIRLKVPKPQSGPRPPRPAGVMGTNVHSQVAGISTSNALAKLQPPPEDAPLGSEHRPWGRLTQFELAKLRKRMKKNAVWQPSTTMINRELTTVGRSLAFYKAAKAEAEAAGKPFEYPWCPPESVPTQSEAPPVEEQLQQQPIEALEEQPIANKGMKLNEQKKAKKDSMAATAAAEAEEAARKLADAAAQMRGLFPSLDSGKTSDKSAPDTIAAPASKPPATAAAQRKRKRDSTVEIDVSRGDVPLQPSKANVTPATPAPNKSTVPHQTPAPILPNAKRPKVETPVPPPPSGIGARIKMPSTASRTRSNAVADLSPASVTEPKAPTSATASTTSTQASSATASTTAPIRPPSPRKSSTPILPPTRNRRHNTILPSPSPAPSQQPSMAAPSLTVPPAPSSIGTRSQRSVTKTPEPRAPPVKPEPAPARAPTPILTLNLSHAARRPSSRGKASSVEPLVTAARDRPHRANTAHNTPAPVPEPAHARPSSRRAKRPPPGKVAAGADGAAAITMGKRTAAPRKKAGGSRKANASKREGSAAVRASADLEVEVDENGIPIDPNEPRYCTCNRVSYGEMIACENEKVCLSISWSSFVLIMLTDWEVPVRVVPPSLCGPYG